MSGLRANTEWKKWGAEDPLFGVSSVAGKQKDGPSPWTDEEFYALGQTVWDDYWRRWQDYAVNTESCLEFGCGAGRVTKALAGTFRLVHAVDVSEGMIRRAQKAVGSNVDFSLIDGTHLPQPAGSVEAVFTTHVLQHLDNVEVGYACFLEFYRVLDKGGTLMAHLPLYDFPPYPKGLHQAAMRFLQSSAQTVSGTLAAFRRRTGRNLMRGTAYPMGELYANLVAVGFKRVEFSFFPALLSKNSLQAFVFATR